MWFQVFYHTGLLKYENLTIDYGTTAHVCSRATYHTGYFL